MKNKINEEICKMYRGLAELRTGGVSLVAPNLPWIFEASSFRRYALEGYAFRKRQEEIATNF